METRSLRERIREFFSFPTSSWETLNVSRVLDRLPSLAYEGKAFHRFFYQAFVQTIRRSGDWRWGHNRVGSPVHFETATGSVDISVCIWTNGRRVQSASGSERWGQWVRQEAPADRSRSGEYSPPHGCGRSFYWRLGKDGDGEGIEVVDFNHPDRSGEIILFTLAP